MPNLRSWLCARGFHGALVKHTGTLDREVTDEGETSDYNDVRKYSCGHVVTNESHSRKTTSLFDLEKTES